MRLIRILAQPPEWRAVLAATAVLAAIGAIVFGHTLVPEGAVRIVGIAMVLGVYLFPTLIAAGRRHPSLRTIAILNITVGWTVIGWTVAFIWAAIWRTPILEERHPCPHCAEAILPAAKVCGYCGSALRAGWTRGAEILTLPRRAG